MSLLDMIMKKAVIKMEQFDEVELIDQINNKKQKPEAEIKKVKKNKN